MLTTEYALWIILSHLGLRHLSKDIIVPSYRSHPGPEKLSNVLKIVPFWVEPEYLPGFIYFQNRKFLPSYVLKM